MRLALGIPLLLCWVARAQNVQGVVLDVATHQPVRKASVTLTALSPDRSYAVALTDSSGNFSLTGIPTGRYRILAARNGYLSIPYGALAPQRAGAVFNMSADQSRTGVTLLLTQANTVSGTVLDPEGDGLPGVQVSLYKKLFDRGKPHFQQTSAAITDSRGQYEIGAVPQGDYAVVAQARLAQMREIRSASVANENLPPESVAPQIYPAAVIIAGNDVTGIDFHPAYVPQISIHGTVSGAPADAPIAVRLDSELAPGLRGAQYNYGVPSGQLYKIGGVPAGSYRLMVHAGLRRAVLKLNLTAPDTALNITLSPGIPLAGTVTVEGSGAEKFKQFRVHLSPIEDLFPPNVRADVEDGEFEFDEIPAGIWDIGVTPLPPGCYIKSMHLGKQDVLLEDMEIGSNTKGPLAIVISTAAPKIEGTVEPAGPATVLAAPTGKLANMSSFFEAVQSDEAGRFTMRGLNPGSYRLYAFRDIEPQSWQDPKTLAPYESQSKPADLKEGATETLTLSVIGASNP